LAAAAAVVVVVVVAAVVAVVVVLAEGELVVPGRLETMCDWSWETVISPDEPEYDGAAPDTASIAPDEGLAVSEVAEVAAWSRPAGRTDWLAEVEGSAFLLDVDPSHSLQREKLVQRPEELGLRLERPIVGLGVPPHPQPDMPEDAHLEASGHCSDSACP